jgi:hypothetical protein
VGVVGIRTFNQSQKFERSSSHQLRGAVQNILASNQSVISPDDVVNFFEQNGDTSLNSQSQSIQGTGTTT